MKNDEEVESKEELEAELLKVRSEIQWREREQEAVKEAPHLYFIVLATIILFLLLINLGIIGVIIWLIVSITLAIIIQKSFDKTQEGKRIQKAFQELKELKKRKTELEKKLDALEDLEKSKKHKRKLSK